ncbi:Uroporphyrinogen decarboxylase [Salix suchowensis]|nr:Uroporphyrinogen decarboxylase [Salix suchowensis]
MAPIPYNNIQNTSFERKICFCITSKTTDLIVEISLQPWEAFHPDGVIIFSDILTPPPAFGVPFDIEEVRDPVTQSPILSTVRNKCPKTPLAPYINGNGERMMRTGVDVIGLDRTGNVDPAYLFSPLLAITDEIQRVVRCAGPRGHILNLVHGVLVVTPEEVVPHFFEVARSLEFSTPQRKSKNW